MSLRHRFQFLFGCITRSGLDGPYGNSIFNFVRNCHTLVVTFFLNRIFQPGVL